jgi:hypothetical protein
MTSVPQYALCVTQTPTTTEYTYQGEGDGSDHSFDAVLTRVGRSIVLTAYYYDGQDDFYVNMSVNAGLGDVSPPELNHLVMGVWNAAKEAFDASRR